MSNKNFTKTEQHIYLRQQIAILREQNQKLKKRLEKMQDAMHAVYSSKKKYKNKYKQLKQKLDILQTVNRTLNKANRNIQSYEYYKNEAQNHNSRQTKNYISNLNNKNRNQSKNNIKQDLTAHTFQTMPSSRKSQFQNHNFKRNAKIIDLKQSNNSSNSQNKQVGKIFKFKSSQKQQRYQSSGSQKSLEKDQFSYYNQQIHPNKKYFTEQQHHNPFSPSNRNNYQSDDYEIYNHLKNKNQYSTNFNRKNQPQNIGLKEMICKLLMELKTFSNIQKNNINSQQNLNMSPQKQMGKSTFTQFSQSQLRQKLEEICSKLKQIQKNQQIFILRTQKQQKSITNNAVNRVKSQKSLNKSTTGKLNNSFLKTIEDIGRDLTQWKIDYYEGEA